MEMLENKLVNLIVNRCINFNQAKALLINCDLKEHVPFAEKIKEKVMELGIEDVFINVNDMDDLHSYLKNTPLEDIALNPLLDASVRDVYAKMGAPIIFLNSTVPGLMDDIELEKISKADKITNLTKRYYRANVSKYLFPWCLLSLPNERWAQTVFPGDDRAYEKLYLTIMKMCMIDRDDPLKAWEEYISKNNYYKNKLNELDIRKIYYQNSLGTDLEVELPIGSIWINLDKTDACGGQLISNLPSYEIFTTPDYRKTNGIVYSSKPLIYNGCIISDFYLEFKDGVVVKSFAKTGNEILQKILQSDDGSMKLGEVALVPNNSPISNTGLVFNDVLFDENASCHLALGDGFAKAFLGYEKSSSDELHERGMNRSDIHVDFMVGTDDLMIEADTNQGKKLILKNGEFNI